MKGVPFLSKIVIIIMYNYNYYNVYNVSEKSLLMSLFTFFLISIRLNSLKPWPHI